MPPWLDEGYAALYEVSRIQPDEERGKLAEVYRTFRERDLLDFSKLDYTPPHRA